MPTYRPPIEPPAGPWMTEANPSTWSAQVGCTCEQCQYALHVQERNRQARDPVIEIQPRRSIEPPEPREVVGHCEDCYGDLFELRYLIAGDVGDRWVCNDCRRRHYRQCAICSSYSRTYDIVHPSDDWNGRRYCRSCANERLNECEGCGAFHIEELHYLDRCTQCCRSDEDNDCDCEECDEYRDGRLIKDYSYKPYPEFHGPGPVHLGLELEINVDYSDRGRTARIATEHLGSLGYLKADSSIDGFEIVTHPMDHEYARDRFPWQMLDELRGQGASNHDAGIHVHVSRKGFDSPSHIFRWLRFIYRNQRGVTRIARRRSGEWASFEIDEGYSHGQYDRNGRRVRNTTVQQFRDFAKGSMDGQRYSAINVQNAATFEVRVFKSSLVKQEVLAALDLVAASVEYTRELTVPAIINGGWSWAGFIKWAKADGRYTSLIAEDERVNN